MNKQIIDEDTANEVWAESARENFETAMKRKDFATAEAVAKDIYDHGFKGAGLVFLKGAVAAKMKVENQFPEETGPEYDKYSTREYYQRAESEYGVW